MSDRGYLEDKRILVTGACGTVGFEVIRQLVDECSSAEVVAFDNNESELFLLEERFRAHGNLTCLLGDIRDKEKLTRVMRGIDVVLHCAAFKHVVLCERSPYEAVQTNIVGVQNVIAAAYENHVPKVLFTSSDKAVNPTNVMGTSKLMGERLMTAATCERGREAPMFFSTRFGNVLGSRSSVLPIFKSQIKHGGPVTLTDEQMTRFVMTVQDAARLVLDTVDLAQGGEVFITKMPVVRISDLAHVMIQELAEQHGFLPDKIEVQMIGAKPGEKFYEELMTEEEIRRALELDRYFVVLPAFRHLYVQHEYTYDKTVSTRVEKPYISESEPALSQVELKKYLATNGLLKAE